MKVALSGIDTRDGALLSKVKKTLESLTVMTQIMKDDDYYRTAKEVDLVMVAGGDRGILDYFHKIEYDSPPVLGIYETDSTGFLAQLDARELESATSQLKRGNYSVEEVFRLAVKVDGKQADPVLNDVAVFPSKSATLMEHVLRIDANDIWH
ncbi:MAG: NAD(+)/NADH kinase, partial [Thermoproteota archaeon]|nr:NAD(+)/NADH kinase [Thermoproteota archaeon]